MSMTNATALIAEDEPLLAAHLAAELTTLWPELKIVSTVGDGESAVQQALALRPQVLFLDIRMPALSGLEAAQAVTEDWPDDAPLPLLVFATAYDEYAVRAFEQAAIDYVLKPVSSARLSLTCQRLQSALAAQQPPSNDDTLAKLRELLATTGSAAAGAAPKLSVIQAGIGNTIHMVKLDDVVYFEAADKYVRAVTADREYLIRTSLRDFLPQLDMARFWQIHRGTVVRSDEIALATRDDSGKLTLSLRNHPDKLAVSRLHAHLFKGM